MQIAKHNFKTSLCNINQNNTENNFLNIPGENYQFKTPVLNSSKMDNNNRKRPALANIQNTDQRSNNRRMNITPIFKINYSERQVNELIESPFKKMSLDEKNERLFKYCWSGNEERNDNSDDADDDLIDPCTRKENFDLFNDLISPIKISSSQQSSPFKEIINVNDEIWDNIPMIDCDEDELMQAEQPSLSELPHLIIPDDF